MVRWRRLLALKLKRSRFRRRQAGDNLIHIRASFTHLKLIHDGSGLIFNFAVGVPNSESHIYPPHFIALLLDAYTHKPTNSTVIFSTHANKSPLLLPVVELDSIVP